MKELIWGKTLRSRLIRYNFFIICAIAIHDWRGRCGYRIQHEPEGPGSKEDYIHGEKTKSV